MSNGETQVGGVVLQKCLTTSRDVMLPDKPPYRSELATILGERGWNVRNAADYLGVSRQRLYSAFADPSHARLWDIAVSHIPVCTPEITKALRDARRNRPKSVSKRKQETSRLGIEIGDGVVATTYAGFADEGEEGWIKDIRGRGPDLELFVCMPRGQDWLPRDDFHDLFATNGKTLQLSASHG